MEKKSSSAPIIITVIVFTTICWLMICLVLTISGSTLLTRWLIVEPTQIIIDQPRPEIVSTQPAEIKPDDSSEIIPEPAVTSTPPTRDGAEETLQSLQEEIIPINDPITLAERLSGKKDIPETFPDPNAPYALGNHKTFWVVNVDTNNNFQVNTTLRYLGENVYIWIENGVDYSETDLSALGDTFDTEIYPTTRAFFGSEWSPGVDHDPRIHIVYAGGLGKSLAGYYSSADQLHPDAHEYSNAHEMFLINSDNVDLGRQYIYGTLAHEFQHMIHWYTDKNEETWLNEGFSMLAELINNFDPGGFDSLYVRDTDLQLTDWGDEVGSNGPHYGASFLFTTYFYDRFGVEATQALVAHEKNGMESIDLVLEELDIRDPLKNDIITSEDVFADWAVTNFLGDSSVGDGRYHYSIYPNAPLASRRTAFSTCPASPTEYTVAQFGVDYLEISCSGNFTLDFKGIATTSILPVNPYSGDYYFWSNMGDHSNMSLERTFDLTNVSSPVEMTFQTWYDIEQDYDYVYVSASTDGENWQILNTTSCTTTNPSGNSYGCGLNGQSDGWQQESILLNQFVGQEVTIRFDYVTDAAVNGNGMVIDDIRLDALDYFSDFERGDGGWKSEGFVRIQNALPQNFRISLISFGRETSVSTLVLDANNLASIEINIGDEIDSVILVISGTTPFTRQRAGYQIAIE